jgi:Protein of unknown function (DUF3179)
VFQRTIDGIPLRFHLAGINNQNFLMRDEQTGTYWQQITGLAVSGPLAGKRLTLVSADELTFALWKMEQPDGMVLDDMAIYAKDYAPKNWDVKMAKAPTVLSFAQAGLKPRDLMLGVRAFGASRAFPYETVLKKKLILDHLGSQPILLVVGPDDRSVRVFRQRIPDGNSTPQFYRIVASANDPQGPRPGALLIDAATGSQWNFQGCAVSGKLKGTCLDHVEVIKDYWFDWRNYNPETTVYGVKSKVR